MTARYRAYRIKRKDYNQRYGAAPALVKKLLELGAEVDTIKNGEQSSSLIQAFSTGMNRLMRDQELIDDEIERITGNMLLLIEYGASKTALDVLGEARGIRTPRIRDAVMALLEAE